MASRFLLATVILIFVFVAGSLTPASKDWQPLIPSRAITMPRLQSFEGIVSIRIMDPSGEIKYFLQTIENGRLVNKGELIFPRQLEEPLLNGSFTPPTGSPRDGENDTMGEQRVAFVLVNFRDNASQPLSTNGASDLMRLVDNYYREVSYEKAWLSTQVFGYYTLDFSGQQCNPEVWMQSVLNNTNIVGPSRPTDIDWTHFDRVMLAFPQTSCSWLGVSGVGKESVQTRQGVLQLGLSWLNGPTGWDQDTTTHELGHNFGLYHANDWECGAVTLDDPCVSVQYGDIYSVMGKYNIGQLNAIEREKLGWFDPGKLQVIQSQTNGIFSLGAIEDATATTQGIRLTGFPQFNYFLEYRRPMGFDRDINASFTDGIHVLIDRFAQAADSQLLDFTPHEGESFWPQRRDSTDSTLRQGRVYHDPLNNFYLRVLRNTATTAEIELSNQALCPADFRVNTRYQMGSQNSPHVAVSAQEKMLLVWNGQNLASPGSASDIAVRAWNEELDPLDVETVLNRTVAGAQAYPVMSALSNGLFLAAWHSDNVDEEGYGIVASVLDSNATIRVPEFRVNQFGAGNQSNARVLTLPNGNAVIAWYSEGVDGSNTGIGARILNAQGEPLVQQPNEFVVNGHNTEGYQWQHNLIGLANGQWAAAWISQVGNQKEIWMRVFNEMGQAITNALPVTEQAYTDPQITDVSIAPLSGERLMVVWAQADQDQSGIFARIGNVVGGSVQWEPIFQVNEQETGYQVYPILKALPNGNVVVGWHGLSIDGEGQGVAVKVYRSDGSILAPELRVNETNQMGDQRNPQIVGTENGGFLVAFEDGSQDGLGFGIGARWFNNQGEPLDQDFMVNEIMTSGNQFLSDLVSLSADRVLVLFYGRGIDEENDGIGARVLSYPTTENNCR